MTQSLSLRQPSIPERIKGYIEQLIVERELKPGDALPSEAELSRRLEVSRGAVREGIKALESTGVIDVRRGDGIYVQPFSFRPLLANLRFGLRTDKRSVAELLQIREVLEIGLIDDVINLQTPPSIDRVRDALDLMHRAAAEGQPLHASDRLFHRSLFAIAGNSLVLDVADIFWEAMGVVRGSLEMHASDPIETYNAHAKVLQAVEQRDAGAARLLLKAHYADIETRLGDKL